MFPRLSLMGFSEWKSAYMILDIQIKWQFCFLIWSQSGSWILDEIVLDDVELQSQLRTFFSHLILDESMFRSWYYTFTSNKNIIVLSTFNGVVTFWNKQCLDHDVAHLNQLTNMFPHLSLRGLSEWKSAYMILDVQIKWQLCFVIWFWMNQCLGPDITHPN